MAARPTFPVYLLPSFKVPFRRRNTDSSDASTSRASYDSSVPSLSSSPDSLSLASTPTGSSPPFPTYFNKGLSSSPQQTASLSSNGKKRLSRTNPDTLRCGSCSVDLAFVSQIVSKGFTGRHGRAYLVAPPAAPNSSTRAEKSGGGGTDLINIRVGRPENRQLVTGAHVVADISCVVCGLKLGWKYVDAKEQSQKYKVGKFILETQRVVSFRSWEDVDAPEVTEVEDVKPPKRDSFTDRFHILGRKSTTRRSVDTTSSSEEEDGEIMFDSDDEDECEDIFAGVWDAEVVAKRRQGRKFGSRRKQSSE